MPSHSGHHLPPSLVLALQAGLCNPVLAMRLPEENMNQLEDLAEMEAIIRKAIEISFSTDEAAQKAAATLMAHGYTKEKQ